MNIKDIAKLAGVSPTTVSRALNGTSYVSKKTQEKIDKVIMETGYEPNLLAAELIRNKTNTIGVILPRIDLATFSQSVEGINDLLRKKGYSILLVNTKDKIEEELAYFNFFQKKRVDGVLYFATEITQEHIDKLLKIKYPIVLIGQSNKQLNFPYVKYDNYNAARSVVNYLISSGHKKIACLAAPETDYELGKMRKEGYIAALRENGIEVDEDIIVDGDWEVPSAIEGVKKILDTAEEIPTAFFTVSHRKAMGIIHYLVKKGYKVPGDFSVVGIDETESSMYYSPSLTTALFDYYGAGERAANLILDLIEGREVEEKGIQMDYKLQIRDSASEIK